MVVRPTGANQVANRTLQRDTCVATLANNTWMEAERLGEGTRQLEYSRRERTLPTFVLMCAIFRSQTHQTQTCFRQSTQSLNAHMVDGGKGCVPTIRKDHDTAANSCATGRKLHTNCIQLWRITTSHLVLVLPGLLCTKRANVDLLKSTRAGSCHFMPLLCSFKL